MTIKHRSLKQRFENLGDYRLPIVVAVIVHVCLIAALSIHVVNEKPYTQMSLNATKPIVEAKAVPAKVIQKQLDRIEAKITAKKRAIAREKRLVKLKAARARAVRIKREKLRIQKRKAVLAAAKARRVAATKAKTLARTKWIKQQKLTKLKAENAKLQKQLLAQQLTADKARIAKAQATAMAIEVDRYKTAILQTISQNWYVPGGISKNIACLLMVRLAPNGEVLNVTLLKGSGNAVLDRSAISAVYKSSPLPVPTNLALFDKFRELRLTVRPENKS